VKAEVVEWVLRDSVDFSQFNDTLTAEKTSTPFDNQQHHMETESITLSKALPNMPAE